MSGCSAIWFSGFLFCWSHFPTWPTFHRGRGMPRGGPRGAMRGGAPRGGLGRGNAPRGAPSGRGGPPSNSNRGGSAARSRPPAAGAPRMLPSAAMSHQAGPPSGSQPKADGYEDYVSSSMSGLPKLTWHSFWCLTINPSVLLASIWRIVCRACLWGIW